jgi:hypothetical protein
LTEPSEEAAHRVVRDEHGAPQPKVFAAEEVPRVDRAREPCAARAEDPQPAVVDQEAAGVEGERAER